MSFTKDHRDIAARLVANPKYIGGAWYGTRTWWTDTDKFALGILSEANRHVEESGDAIGRQPSTLAWKARDLGLVLPESWAAIIRPKYKPKKISLKHSLLAYPYIAKARDEHSDLLAVNAIIPKGIADHMRADMCQEIMLAILEGRTTIEALKAKKANASYFIKKFYHDNYEAGGHAISFQDTDDEWDSDAVASSIAAKEWRENQMRHDRGIAAVAVRTFTPPTQFEAVWQDQIGKVHLDMHNLGHFLSRDEIEEILEAESAE